MKEQRRIQRHSGIGTFLLSAMLSLMGWGGLASQYAEAAPAQDPKPGQEEKKPPRQPVKRTPVTPKKPAAGDPKPADEVQPPDVDPELVRQIEGALEQEAARQREEARKKIQQRRALRGGARPAQAEGTPQEEEGEEEQQPAPVPSRPQPRPTRVSEPPTAEPGEEAETPKTRVEIAAVQNHVPPEEKEYYISCKDCTYEQLVEGFARQTGLGVIGDVPKDGKVSFVTTEPLSFRAALGRIRVLLFNYKPREPYYIDRLPTHLEVLSVNDKYRTLTFDKMYATVEDFRTANPADDELCLLIYTPKSGSVADLRVVRDFLPDYVRVTPLEDGTSVTIYALVEDIKKYLSLIPIFVRRDGDPRTLKLIQLEYVTPSEAMATLQTLIPTDGGGGASRQRAAASRSPRQPSPLDTMTEPDVTIIPNDAHGTLLVKAMQDKIEEIESLLPFIDLPPASQGYEPVIIPIEHADITALIETLKQVLVFTADAGDGATPARSSRRSTKRPVGGAAAAGGAAPTDGAVMLPHPTEHAIIVLGDEASVERIRELVKQFDVKSGIGPIRIEIAHATASDLITQIQAILGGGGGEPGKSRASVPSRLNLIAAPTEDAIWYTGTERELDRVREYIAILDVPDESVKLHVYQLRKNDPSFVANLLREFDRSEVVTAQPPGPSKPVRGRRARPVTVSKFTADDMNGRFYAICGDDEWAKYVPIIEQLEASAGDEPPFVRLPVTHIAPTDAVVRLFTIYPDGSDASIRFVAAEGAVLVLGASAFELDEIKLFLAEMDVSKDLEEHVFVIRHRPPEEIKVAIEALVGDDGAGAANPRRPQAKPGSNAPPTIEQDLIIIQMTDRLLVRTTPEKMVEVARLVGELDMEDQTTEVRVYADFPPGADIETIADTLAALLGVPQPRSPKGSVRGAGPDGPRYIPQSAAGRLVVVAKPVAFPEIERLLAVLRTSVEFEPFVTDFIAVQHADPEELVGLVSPLIDMRARQLVQEGRLQDLSEAVKGVGVAKRPGQVSVTSDHYHMDADVRNGQIVISAPQILVDEARSLVERFDQPSESDGTCHRTVKLANADPGEVVKALKEMVATSSRVQNRRGAKPQVADEAVADVSALTSVAVPGAQAVFLQGPCDAVAQAEEWVGELDAGSGGRVVKVYEIKRADIKQLAEIIMNVVDAPTVSPGRKPAGRPRGSSADDLSEDPWETSKTWQGADLYIQADLIGHSMIVAAPGAKIARVDELVRMFDPEEGETVLDAGTKRVPLFFYDLTYAEALDAAFNLESMLEMIWEPADQVPEVDASFFGNTLVIRYPDESRFDEIRALIRERIDKLPPEKLVSKRVMFDVPPGITPAELANRLKSKYSEFDIEITDVTDTSDIKRGLEVLDRYDPNKDNPCVLPSALARCVDDLLTVTVGLLEPGADGGQSGPLPPAKVEDRTPGQAEPEPEPDLQDQIINDLAKSKKAEKKGRRDAETPAEEPETRSSAPAPFRGAKLRIAVDEITGTMLIEGPAGVLDDVPDWIDEIKGSIDESKVRPDIRIVRVRYIDVYQATEILEEMFNATRQQRQMVQQQQRLMQQQQRIQQQQAQQRARQQQQQQGKDQQQPGRGQPGQPGQPGQAQQVAVPELPPTQVRVFPNPRDRTLILRADTSQFPAIFELLATIDRPQPINSEFEVFKLKKLNAAEVETMLTSMLGLDVARAGRPGARGARGGARQAPTADAGGELPQTIMAEMPTGGSLGVNPEDIKLTSNEETNTIIAMAPPVALEFIRDIIKRLENEQLPDRVARYYELKHAKAEEVAEYLRTHYEEQQVGGSGGSGKRAAPPTSQLNLPSFVAYPPQNLVTALANEEQFAEIDGIVARLDVPGDKDQWQHVELVHANAKSVADALSTMYGGAAVSSVRSPRQGGGASIGSAGGPTFFGEEGGRILFFSAPESDRQKILDTVARFEEQAEDIAAVRHIDLKYAEPSAVAAVVQEALGASTGGRGQRGAPNASFTISAHDPSKQLFVVADDELFAQIEAIATQLDSEDATLGEVVRVVPLLYTDVAEMQTAIEKYLAKPGQGGGKTARGSGGELAGDVRISPLTQSNALVVSGGKTDVDRIEGIIQQLDVAGEKGSVPQMIKLQYANALDVATTIEGLFPQTGGQRGGKSAVVVVANEAANTLLIKADRSDFTAIETLVANLDTEEEVQPNFRIVTVAAGVNVTELAEEVEGTINKSVEARPSVGKNRVQPSISASPNRRSNAIVLAGSASLFDEAEKLIREIETLEPAGAQTFRIIELGNVPAADIQQLIEKLKGDSASSGSSSSRRSGRSGNSSNRSGGGSRRPARRPGG